ncbi:MAG: hypothetical protein IJW31_09690 [Lentisphaeria bacterium]|nr:hypothetical protein [Lentisphaeria bacterium]
MNNISSPHSAISLGKYNEEKQKEEKLQNLQIAGAKANIESYQLLQQQLAKQVEINQRLEHEFRTSGRKSNIALIIGFVSLIIAILSFCRG